MTAMNGICLSECHSTKLSLTLVIPVRSPPLWLEEQFSLGDELYQTRYPTAGANVLQKINKQQLLILSQVNVSPAEHDITKVGSHAKICVVEVPFKLYFTGNVYFKFSASKHVK